MCIRDRVITIAALAFGLVKRFFESQIAVIPVNAEFQVEKRIPLGNFYGDDDVLAALYRAHRALVFRQTRCV